MNKFDQALSSTHNLRGRLLSQENKNGRNVIIEYWHKVIERADLDIQQKASLISSSISYDGVNDNGDLEWFSSEAGKFELSKISKIEWEEFIKQIPKYNEK